MPNSNSDSNPNPPPPYQAQEFVRQTLVPPAPPPMGQVGLIKWMHENLFSSVYSGVITLVTLFVVYHIAMLIVPWFWHGIWHADSIRDCYDQLEQLGGVSGGCFAVITERWNQLLFGVAYPSDQYWRPVIAFVLLFVALSPVLFVHLPRKMLLFTGVFPFLAYWLIWGGSILYPAIVLIAVVVFYETYKHLIKTSFVYAALGGFIAALLVHTLLGSMLDRFAVLQSVLVLESVPSRDIGGFMVNFILGSVCISFSLPIGIALALGRQSDMPAIKMICVVFIEFIRGVPLITLLFVANVILAYFLPLGTNFDLILRVIIMITLFASAYIAEVVRGGLAALPRGQYEAADSLGLDYAQTMQLIILPQALKISIPGIVNVAIGLFKDTTLVSVISMFDMIGVIRGPIQSSTAWNGVYWELFGFAAILFFVFCYSISQYSQYLERRLAVGHH